MIGAADGRPLIRQRIERSDGVAAMAGCGPCMLGRRLRSLAGVLAGR